MALVLAACAGDARAPSTSTIPSTIEPIPVATTSPPTLATTTAAPQLDVAISELASYRFRVELAVAPQPLSATYRGIAGLAGAATTSPESTQLIGVSGTEEINLVSDGERWWDFNSGEELDPGDLELSLAALGFLLPSTVEPLLANESAWREIGDEPVAGLAATVWRREDIVKDVDWNLGDVDRIDVWRNDAGDILKFVAWFATGDNTGFPVSIYEIVDINPNVSIELPEA